MGAVVLDISMSLDGYVSGVGGAGVDLLHKWIWEGDPGELMQGGTPETTGAAIVGRATYDEVGGWGGTHPSGIGPICVLTEHEPPTTPQGASTFHFGSDIAEMVDAARTAAGDKNVYIIGGADVAQQALAAGLVDELRIHVVHVLLGGGTSLFGALEQVIELSTERVVGGVGVTHLFLKPEATSNAG